MAAVVPTRHRIFLSLLNAIRFPATLTSRIDARGKLIATVTIPFQPC